MTTLLASALDTHANPLAFVAWFGCLCGIYIFGQGFYLLRHKRRLGGIPLSTIQDSSLGPLQIRGVAAGEPPLTSAAAGKLCFYYRATVWRQNPAHDDLWERAAEETRRKPFLLRDDSGELLVDPEGAEIDLPRDTHDEYGKILLATHTDIPGALEDFLARYHVSLDATLRVEEFIIAPGTEVFVSGKKIANPAARKADPPETDPKTQRKSPLAVLTTAAQIIHLTPASRPVPAAEMTMQSRVAAALSLARTQTSDAKPAPLNAPSLKVAYAEPEKPREPEPAPAPTNAVPTTPFMVCQSEDDSPFRISHRALSTAAPPSRQDGVALLILGPLMTAASTYILLLTLR